MEGDNLSQYLEQAEYVRSLEKLNKERDDLRKKLDAAYLKSPKDMPTYRDLSEREIEDILIRNQVMGVAIRKIIDADRALQLKSKTVKCRLYKNKNGAIRCATGYDGTLFVDESANDWVGPLFEREI